MRITLLFLALFGVFVAGKGEDIKFSKFYDTNDIDGILDDDAEQEFKGLHTGLTNKQKDEQRGKWSVSFDVSSSDSGKSKRSKSSRSKDSDDYYKSSKRSDSNSHERKECYMRLSKLDQRFRKCEVDGQKLTSDLAAAGKKLDKLQKDTRYCREKKKCDIYRVFNAFAAAGRNAYECIGDVKLDVSTNNRHSSASEY